MDVICKFDAPLCGRCEDCPTDIELSRLREVERLAREHMMAKRDMDRHAAHVPYAVMRDYDDWAPIMGKLWGNVCSTRDALFAKLEE